MVSLYSAISVYPGIMQTVASSLSTVEPCLFIPGLRLPGIFQHVLEGDLFLIVSPRIGQDGIGRDILDQNLGQAESLGFISFNSRVVRFILEK